MEAPLPPPKDGKKKRDLKAFVDGWVQVIDDVINRVFKCSFLARAVPGEKVSELGGALL